MDTFVFVPFQGGIEGGGYFQVLYEGSQLDFYKKIVKDFEKAKVGKKGSYTATKDVPANFSDNPDYYLVTKTGKFYQFPKSKSKKLKVFGEKEKEMKKYVKSNKLDLNEEKDLINAVKHYEMLDAPKK